jgi:Domain of unknown function (DUF4174)
MNSKSAVHAAGLAVALALCGALTARAEGLPLPELGEYLGRHRVLVIDTPDSASADYQIQAAALLPDWAGLLARDLAIVTQTKASSFRVRLVGKDGGVKLDSAKPVAADALFAMIDAMPMRRKEAAARK